MCSYASVGACQVARANGQAQLLRCPHCPEKWQHHMCTTAFGYNDTLGCYTTDDMANKQEYYERHNTGVCYDCLMNRPLDD